MGTTPDTLTTSSRPIGESARPWAILSFCALALVVTDLPSWIARWLDLNSLVSRLVVSVFALFLLVIVPAALRRWAPHAAGFEIKWLPRKKGDYLWSALLLGSLALVSLTCGLLERHYGWPQAVRVPIQLEFISLAALGLSWLLIILGAPVAEEIFWRGYVQAQFQRVFGSAASVVLQAALFAVLHGYPFPGTVYLFAVGVLLGCWRRWKGSLLPLIVGHIVLNGIVAGPTYFRHYESSQWLAEAREDPTMREWLSDFGRHLDVVRGSAKGDAIDALGRRPADRAVPGLLQYLGDPDESVQTYAQTMLVVRYKSHICRYIDDALESDNPTLVRNTAYLAGYLKCRESLPVLLRVTMQSDDIIVQRSALFALFDLKDMAGLKKVAAEHPDEKLRKSAAQFLTHMP